MRVHLFKEPHIDHEQPETSRLLFEKISEAAPDLSERCRDFYLYVWIDREFRLAAFQAVIDDEEVLSWKAGEKTKFGVIGQQPFLRSIRDSSSRLARRRAVSLCSYLQGNEFPELLQRVSLLAQDKQADITMCDAEKRELSILLKDCCQKRLGE